MHLFANKNTSGTLAASYQAGSGTDSRWTYVVSFKKEKKQASKPQSYEPQLSFSNKPVIWSKNYNLPDSKLSSILPLDNGLVLDLCWLRQECAEEKRTPEMCCAPNWSTLTSIATTLYWDSPEVPLMCCASFSIIAGHPCVPVRANERYWYYTLIANIQRRPALEHVRSKPFSRGTEKR